MLMIYSIGFLTSFSGRQVLRMVITISRVCSGNMAHRIKRRQ